ncbi:MAG: hypothetical protein LBN98_02255 [Prevotellaceae bacterium]|jgi:predicted membrane protein|nr:hypothetical protein [Prevotellaceae bacterium]
MEEVKNTNRKKKTSIVKDVASGKLFFNLLWTKWRLYVFLSFVLAIGYISQHYYVEQTMFAAKKMEEELTHTRMEYTIRASEFMRFSKRSTIEQEIKKRNMSLIAPQRPPKQIKMD